MTRRMVGILEATCILPELSIVVPIHNISGATSSLFSWVEEALAVNVQVILVHDLSTDDTGQLLRDFVDHKATGLLSLIDVNAQSPGLARNAGLKEVSTPWISFADADDQLNIPNLLAMLKEARNSGSSIAIGSYIAENLMTRNVSKYDVPQKKIAENLAVSMGLWRCIFSKEILLETSFESFRMAEDYLFLYEILNKTENIYTCNLPVYKYFYGGKSNLTSVKSNMRDMLKVIGKIQSIQPSNDLSANFQRIAIVKLYLSALKNMEPHQSMAVLPKALFTFAKSPVSTLSTILLVRGLRGKNES